MVPSPVKAKALELDINVYTTQKISKDQMMKRLLLLSIHLVMLPLLKCEQGDQK